MSRCIYAYEWKWWKDFLLPTIAPQTIRLRACLAESCEDVLSRLPSDCGAFIFHVNLTDSRRTPIDRQALCETLRNRGISVLNGKVTDISKRRVQALCKAAGLATTSVSREGEPGELLVAKTNRNACGSSEASLSREESQLLGIRSGQIIWDYIRLPRHAMPEFLWQSEDVVVERWIQNAADTFYRVYAMQTKVVISKVHDPKPLKRMPDDLDRMSWFVDDGVVLTRHEGHDFPGHVADAVARFRQISGLDFGALDLVEDDHGVCYVIDANATPLWGNTRHAEVVAFLASGLPVV